MSKFYAVELSVTAIVQVEDDQDELFAETLAMDLKRDILADNPLEVMVRNRIRSLQDLKRYGWDGMCLPYGGDGNTRLKDLLDPPSLPTPV